VSGSTKARQELYSLLPVSWQFQQVEKVHDALTTLLEQDI